MKSDRDRRTETRDDAASAARALQQRDARALKRLLLTVLGVMLLIAAIGYAMAIWWR
jgi:hypothetical protein